MKPQLLRKCVATLSLVTSCLLQLQAADFVFEKQLVGGRLARMEADPVLTPESNKTVKAVTNHYALYIALGTNQPGSVLWSRDLPAYADEPGSPNGFHVLDLAFVRSNLFLCYKFGRLTFVEAVDGPLTNGEASTELLTDPNSDGYGVGLMAMRCRFEETNGTPLLRLGGKGLDVRAWALQGAHWLRATQYDLKIPIWARPVNLSAPRISGGPYREFFPAADYPDAHWGKPLEGVQVGLESNQAVYKPVETIAAIIHVRNTSGRLLQYQISNLACPSGPIDLLITNSAGTHLESKLGDIAVFAQLLDKKVENGTQLVHRLFLNQQYDPPAGTYTMSARIKVPRPGGHDYILVDSGELTFTIAPTTGGSNKREGK